MELAELSKSAIINAEAGLLSRPPESLLPVLYSASTIAQAQIEYESWQHQHRAYYAPNFIACLPPFANAHSGPGRPPAPSWTNWFELRAAVAGDETQMRFCKMFCLHPQVLRTWETNPHRALSGMVRYCLLDAGVSEEELRYVDRRLIRSARD